MKKYRLYIDEEIYIDIEPNRLKKLKNVKIQYNNQELNGKQIDVAYKELKYPFIIITPFDNFLEVELPDEKDNKNE
mgnify:CR=1 FL=1